MRPSEVEVVAVRGRCLGILLSVAVLGGCGSAAPATAPASATPIAAASATAVPTPTPSPTPVPPKTVADLIADPLPTVTYADLAALDPANAGAIDAIQKFVVSVDKQDPGSRPGPGLATDAYLCGAPFKQATTAERLSLREVHCLLLAADGWMGYAASPVDDTFKAARTAYAFAASNLGADGRAWLDSVLTTRIPAGGAQFSPVPSPSGLRSAADLLATKAAKVDPSGLATVIRDAVAADPVRATAWHVDSTIQVGSQLLADPGGQTEYPKGYAIASAIDVCAHGYPGAFNGGAVDAKYDLDMQDSCQTLIFRLFKAYQATGAPVFWDAAVFALRMGIQGAPPCASLGLAGNGCPDEWLGGLALALGK